MAYVTPAPFHPTARPSIKSPEVATERHVRISYNRGIEAPSPSPTRQFSGRTILQRTAAVNPGNVGGPCSVSKAACQPRAFMAVQEEAPARASQSCHQPREHRAGEFTS